jgi:hypothetical protein
MPLANAAVMRVKYGGQIKSVSEVVRSIPSGSHIALAGFAIARTVIAVVQELIRPRRGFTERGAGAASLM